MVYYATPGDLGFIPAWLIEPNEGFGLGLLLFLCGTSFFGGILQLYSLTDRGFSLRIAIEIDNSADRSMTVDEVVRSYSAGKGINWMYQKRIDDLTRQKLIEVIDNEITPTVPGARVAGGFSWLRQFLRVAG